MDTSSSSLTAVTEKRQDDRPDALSVNYVNEGNDPLTSSRTTLVDYVKDKGDICLFDSSGKQVRDLIKCGWSLLDFILDIQRRDLKEDLCHQAQAFSNVFSTRLTFDPIEIIAYLHWGYHNCATEEDRVEIQNIDGRSRVHLQLSIAKELVEGADNISDELEKGLNALVSRIRNSKGDTRHIPAYLCDLRPNNAKFIGRILGKRLTFERQRQRASVQGSERHRELKESELYFLDPQVNIAPWKVATTDAKIVLHCVRSGLTNVYDIAHHLVQRGMTFLTPVTDPGIKAESDRLDWSRSMRLGRRMETDKPDFDDYRQYERRLFELMQDERIARASVLPGGILWRLVVEVIGLDAATDLVLDGPTNDRVGILYRLLDVEQESKKCVLPNTVEEEDRSGRPREEICKLI